MLSPTVAQLELGELPDVPASPAQVPISDEDLMLRVAQNDYAAFDQLYGKFKAPLFRFVLRAVGERALAEDLAQDVWVKLVDARVRYSPSAKFKTYLFRIAHNRVIDHYRRQQPLSLSALRSEPSGEDRLDLELDAEQSRLAVQAAIAELPLDQRSTLLLKVHGEFSLNEIASMTGVGRETVKSRLRYAMKKLREVLSRVPGVRDDSS